MKKYFTILTPVLAALLLFSCKKENYKYEGYEVKDMAALAVGKTFYYKLDSLTFPNFGEETVIKKYQAKDVVDAAIKDGQGRNAFRIIRYLRDSASNNENDWRPAVTYSITPTTETLEQTDFNNFRFQSLKIPVKEGYNWKGNRYNASSPFENLFDFTVDYDYEDWDYTYPSVGTTAVIEGKTYNDVVTVKHVDDEENVTDIPKYSASKRYSVEKYAKGVGLIYKEIELWEFQPKVNPNNPNLPPIGGYKEGFGIKLRLVKTN
jgi:hypothetical protein